MLHRGTLQHREQSTSTKSLPLCWEVVASALQGTAQTSPSPPPSAAATDEDRGETKRARQRKRKDPEVVDERTMRMQKRMVGSAYLSSLLGK